LRLTSELLLVSPVILCSIPAVFSKTAQTPIDTVTIRSVPVTIKTALSVPVAVLTSLLLGISIGSVLSFFALTAYSERILQER
jgi:hypothetical protein